MTLTRCYRQLYWRGKGYNMSCFHRISITRALDRSTIGDPIIRSHCRSNMQTGKHFPISRIVPQQTSAELGRHTRRVNSQLGYRLSRFCRLNKNPLLPHSPYVFLSPSLLLIPIIQGPGSIFGSLGYHDFEEA